MNKSVLTISALSLALVLIGCAKKEEAAPADAPADATAAAPAADAPAAADAATAPAAEAAATDEDPEVARKRREVEFALAEEALVGDARGQWAATAKASSTYNDAQEPASYSAFQATGAPNVVGFGDNGNAWCPKEDDGGIERLEVGFSKPVNATEIRVRQNSAPGAIIKVELIDTEGKLHVVHDGIDAAKYDSFNFWFKKTFEKTPYKVAGAKITLATNAVAGWNEIDAVQLLGD
jgi:pyruvate/2-oxoglutarate dehydrogenase complex dihydrolipoamide acyltransferase (E2) component